ncbi:GIY-YIG nuclease family protein [Patescibacteria group bacterium]|nr:GIY-YIG nuclease family protein [Patescibacteria group bacterium]MBU4000148.1 GIY-YIG nuclease family protein [Patescibacteria group bacterium]MBU4368952.1 GIY-YIG nuclease family protein [Patescibacteria group bacterium]
MYYVYILQSEKDNKFYTGYTKNLKLRFEQHRRGLVESTKNRKPLNIIYYEACLNQQDATHREKYLKTYLGKMFIKNRLARWFSQSE